MLYTGYLFFLLTTHVTCRSNLAWPPSLGGLPIQRFIVVLILYIALHFLFSGFFPSRIHSGSPLCGGLPLCLLCYFVLPFGMSCTLRMYYSGFFLLYSLQCNVTMFAHFLPFRSLPFCTCLAVLPLTHPISAQFVASSWHPMVLCLKYRIWPFRGKCSF